MSAEQGGIALAHDASEALVVHAAFVHDAGQGTLGKRELLAGLDTLEFGDPLFDHFLLARLHREIGHGEGNGILARIAILGDQVAGVAIQREIVDLS